jgi:nucleotide-binding universal stress UspA family protein
MTIRKILFPTDFSRCSDQALIHALSLAERYCAFLSIVHVLLPLEYDPYDLGHHLPDLQKLQDEIDRLSSCQVESAIERKSFRDIAIEQSTIRGISAAPAILEHAADMGIDLIVMGTHGRRGINHFILGSVAEEVVRLAPCPVMTVREKKLQTAGTLFKQILVPIDFSEFSRDAISHGRHLANEFGATVRLLHIVEEAIHPTFYVTGQTSLTAWYPEIEATTLKEMKRLAEDAAGPQVPLEFHIKEGRAAVGIIGFARKNEIDLIVMASHGLTGLEHFLLGSVTEKVVRMSPCPLFTLKSFGKSLLRNHSEEVLGSGKQT